MRKQRWIPAVLGLSILLGTALCACAGSDGRLADYESLLEEYRWKWEHQGQMEALHRELAAPYGEEPVLQLWEQLWKREGRARAGTALALIEQLLPEGNPERWKEVGGFWRPEAIPRSLAALDGVIVAAEELLALPGTASDQLALSLLQGLAGDSTAASLVLRRGPQAARRIYSGLQRARLPLPPAFPRPQETIGSLPLARRVREMIPMGRAVREDFPFLNALGVPTSGAGPYAWDREEGKIYRVVEGNDEDLLFWFRFNGAFPGGPSSTHYGGSISFTID
ncbi:MAG: hypothetical protein K9L28_00005 [Synergistales bacterium]|nr:hypothetical protein [Synergistales bacterium]